MSIVHRLASCALASSIFCACTAASTDGAPGTPTPTDGPDAATDEALRADAALDAPVAPVDSAPRTPTIKGGSASGATKLSVPAKIAGLRSDPFVVAGYLDVTHYGADPSGTKDSTAAFQAALNDAGSDAKGSIGATMAVYVPPGTYSISNTITAYQIFNGKNTNLVNASYGAGNGILAPALVGPGSGPRPTIVLKDGVFGDHNDPHPMLHMVNTPDAGKGGCGGQWGGSAEVGCWDILFNAVVRDIDFKVGNNPGAIGVQFYSAQMSYMQNVHVDATGGYAGIQGSPATEAWVNIEVDGGEYGVMIDRTAGVNALVGLKLSHQSVAGIRDSSVGGLSITGFDIEEDDPAATAIITKSPVNQGGMLALMDGTLITAGDAAITNGGDFSVYMNNVFAKTPKHLLMNRTAAVDADGAMHEVKEYAHADPTTNAATIGYALGAEIVIDDKSQSADYGPIYGSAVTPPADLMTRNTPGQMPWAFDRDVAWVTDYGADPTGAADSTAGFHAAIEAAHAAGTDAVFMPRGHYKMSATTKLYPETKFFGLPGGFSQLGAPDWNPGSDVAFILDVGGAVSDAARARKGTAVVSDVSFGLSTTGTAAANAEAQSHVAAMRWQAGAHSIANQVFVSYQYNSGLHLSPPPPSRNIVQVDGTGGGRWYGLQIGGDWGPNGADGYSFVFENTTEPASVYGSNIEHASGKAFYGFVGAANVRILGAKAEDGSAPHWFHLSSGAKNVMISAISNHDPRLDVYMTADVTDVNVDVTSIFATYMFTNARITDGKTSYPFADNYALFGLGHFDESVFSLTP